MKALARRIVRSIVVVVLLYAMPAAGQEDAREAVRKAGEAFLVENQTKQDVVTLPSGLQYQVLEAGTGKTPTMDDTVLCHFRGTHIDGNEFTSSYGSKRPTSVSLKRALKGWAEALQLMPVGSKWRLFVPPHLAYGDRGVRGRVPPNATVIFDVELVAIAGRKPAVQVGPLHAIEVAFKLDPRTTQGLYLGERWVSPPRYNRAGDAKSVTVEARASGRDAKGVPKATLPTWVPANPDLVTVTPARGTAVTIIVHGVGETALKVTADGVSRDLAVKSQEVGGVLQVEITQNGTATK